jgi:hypothetical protein
LAKLYWSYDACKRGFLEGCKPFICLDGCHIKTRYKGNLLTAVGIDPNDCIFPIAMGLVQVECTSSWEWFLTTLRDRLLLSSFADSIGDGVVNTLNSATQLLLIAYLLDAFRCFVGLILPVFRI